MKKSTQVSAFDVAAYILRHAGPMTHMKLQKLLYYCQAWSLVWDDEALFREPIEAWVNGPIVRSIYRELRGRFMVRRQHLPQGDASRLSSNQKETVDVVLQYYKPKSSQWLSDLTHMERPWAEAREGLAPTERSNREITRASMAEYYSSLQ